MVNFNESRGSNTIVWTNGCFDVLHAGHIELFKYAKQQGSKLYVGVDSDEKIKADKGDDRPFNKLDDRVKMLEAIRYIDKVYVFDNSKGLSNLIKQINPYILVVGSDWKGKTIVGEEHVEDVRFFNRIEGYSTTEMMRR
tara:strand:- start:1032 stop:1448 length:417 start_codon:yes stop_codon:yes gene_type:complete